jgi:hypothetical protein
MLAPANRDSFSRDPLPVCLRAENPNRLVSLWDIVNAFPLPQLLFSLENLRLIESSCDRLRKKQHGGVPALQKDLVYARKMLPLAQSFCRQMSFTSSSRLLDSVMLSLGTEDEEREMESLRQRLSRGNQMRIDVAEFETEIRHVRETIEHELQQHGYVHVAADRVEYFMQKHLFGANVSECFPKARHDILEAGNCIAVESGTAAVFHLMRVAEHGLRALAKRLRVKLTDAGKAHPIELAEWNKIITGVKNKIEDIRKLPKGAKRQAQLERYSDAADHCMFMKDIWRNAVSHAQKPYTDPEAIGVFGRVRDFMVFLASSMFPTVR